MRTVRHRKPENFLSAVGRNAHGISEEELLTPEEAAHEALVMGLRLAEGIEQAALRARLNGHALVDERSVDRMVGHGLLERDGPRIRTSSAGRLLLDAILAEIAA